MEETRSKPAREAAGSHAAVVMLLLFVAAVPVIYVLGLGPVVWYVQHTGGDPGIWESIYAPLEWLARQSTIVRDAITWYVEMWR